MTDVQALRDMIEAERVRFDVPGVAVAVVVDDELVLAEGFGVRDRETGAPVTPQTLFPIASDTKCFTAAMLCSLADEGVLDLDAPVRSYIPWFAMNDPHASELVSTRDLLSHRTGLPRHDFVWYGETDLDLEDVVRALPHLASNKQLRQAWQYNNLAYSTAGYLTEQLTGQAWVQAVRTRLLEPLGMKSTVFSARAAADGDYAFPYNKVAGELTRQVLPADSKLGPPGGIVSNVEDLSRWVLARLGKEVEGARPLSDTALTQLHSPAMVGGVGGIEFSERQPMGYALGCQVESYRGHRIVRHGGNLVGYSSDVCIAPDLGAAVVVLTNMHGTALRDAVPLMVLDHVLGIDPVAWGERYHTLMTAMLEGKAAATEHRAEAALGRPPTRRLDEFAGRYHHPAYGTLTLTAAGDRLAVDFHGLADRISVSHRDRDVWDLNLLEFELSVPLVFRTGSDAEVTGLSIPIEPLVDPVAFTKSAPPVSPGLLERISGSYTFGPLTAQVRVVEGNIEVSIPGAPKLPLAPLGGNAFRSPAMSTVRAEFERAEDGAVTRLVIEPIGIFTKDDRTQ
ncbi:MAG TPA: serine hydrolase [Mycobacteriales bacterium]|nr:serine hydrolase [Mycobacteriales bacterium]